LRRGQPDLIAVLVLVRLAVDGAEQRQGLGADLLRDALIRAVAGARQYGARAVIVDAIDEAASGVYTSFGFVPLTGRRLCRRVSDIQRAHP
jgi:predicted N-acetyltransferase YhbS